MSKSAAIKYPYLPPGRTIQYVSADHPMMRAARTNALTQSLDQTMPTASLIAKDGQVLGLGANGSTYHQTNPCRRVILGVPTGQGYELCEGCDYHNHSEIKAISAAQQAGHNLAGAELYLWGHWWCCQPCWQAIEQAKIGQVYLLSGSQILFNRDASGNIVGRQFES